MSEIVKSEYNALGEDNNYKTHYFKTSADQVVGLGRMKNTEYQVGDVVYSDTNNKVALKCTTDGITSNTELDISGNNVGDTVTDGTCVWNIVGRISDSVPIGTIFAFGANEHPIGYLACDGTAVSRIVYADLFAVIGTTYGAGDGSTTFNLPNLNNNSFLEGSNTAGTVKSAGLPNIRGTIFGTASHKNTGKTGALWQSAVSSTYKMHTTDYAGNTSWVSDVSLDASRWSAVYKDGVTTVQPKAVTVKFCIKAYGAITNAGSVELEEMAKDYEAIAQRTSVVEQTLPKKANLGALSMPSDYKLYISIPTFSNTSDWDINHLYTAPVDGWLNVSIMSTSNEWTNETSVRAAVGEEVFYLRTMLRYTEDFLNGIIPCRKGQSFYFQTNKYNAVQIKNLAFIYAQSEV